MLELKNIVKSFNRRRVIDNLSFKVDRGEKLVILGPSGSGKTTILRLIAGFEKPDVGIVMINGEYADNIPVHKREIGMVFQDLALWPHMTVRQNISFCLRSKEKKEEKIEEILNSVGLSQHWDYYPPSAFWRGKTTTRFS